MIIIVCVPADGSSCLYFAYRSTANTTVSHLQYACGRGLKGRVQKLWMMSTRPPFCILLALHGVRTYVYNTHCTVLLKVALVQLFTAFRQNPGGVRRLWGAKPGTPHQKSRAKFIARSSPSFFSAWCLDQAVTSSTRRTIATHG